MIRKIATLLCFVLITTCPVQAQKAKAKVKSFSELVGDTTAVANPRYDRNGDYTAVVNIQVPNPASCSFEGNLVGDPVVNDNQVQVYMTRGSRFITIKSDNFGTVRYEFPYKLKNKYTYGITMKIRADKENRIKTLLMPSLGLGDVTAPNIMIGFVNKRGMFLRIKYNFSTFTLGPETDVDVTGNILSEGKGQAWFTANHESRNTRAAATICYIAQLTKKLPNLYMYGGAGYGVRQVRWKDVNDDWYQYKDKSTQGVEGELGLLYNVGVLSFSAGYQTNMLKYNEVNIGIGVMF